MEFKFAIVEFISSKSVGTIPRSWISNNGTKCFYPPEKNFKKALDTNFLNPGEKWKQYDCRVLVGVGKILHILFLSHNCYSYTYLN